jgi:ribonuclease G
MKKDILISRESGEVRVAILKDGNLEEFFIERDDASKQFGNIYKGIVKSIIPGMGAAFVDLGTAKDGFLYVDDALANPLDEEMSVDDSAEKGGHRRRLNIDEVLKQGQEIIVQVVKEGIRNKGPRMTTHFSLPARYLVLMPGDRRFGISKRVDNRTERDRIRKIFDKTELPEDAGIIVRTAGEGKSEKEFERDIKYTTQLWKKIRSAIKRKKAPAVIHEEFSLVERVIRDYYTDDVERIIVDDKEIHKLLSKFIRLYLPGQKVSLELHKGEDGALFDAQKVNREVEKTFQQKVYLKCGAHLVIEQTEALVSIDINTGKFTGKKNLEETVCRANVEAAREVARQLRLRDMGGVIIIDFIDMQRYENRRRVMQELWEELKNDRAKTNVLPFSDIGMVEMTRQRIRPSIESAVYDACNYCEGKAVVKSVSSMAIETFRKVKRVLQDEKHKTIEVSLQPEVASRILSQDRETLREFEKRSKNKVILLANSSLHREDIQVRHVN